MPDLFLSLGSDNDSAAVWGNITGTLTNQTDLQASLTAAATTAVWGSISGTLSAQTDLQTALNAKITAFADPNADRIVFWDDSAGAFAALAPDSTLTVSGTTLSVTGPTEATTTSTGTQDNFSFSNASVLRCNNASLLTIRGLVAGVTGQILHIVSVGAGNVELAHQNSNSTDVNRLVNQATSANTPLFAGNGTATYVYDGTTQRWRLIAHDQGGWITPTFSAGDYTANGSMTWTVESGDVTTMAYWLKHKTLFLNFRVLTTSIGGTLNTQLLRVIPGGFTNVNSILTPISIQSNGVAAVGLVVIAAAATNLSFRTTQDGATNWTASTNNASVNGCITLEVS
jgi:hypothetical protein